MMVCPKCGAIVTGSYPHCPDVPVTAADASRVGDTDRGRVATFTTEWLRDQISTALLSNGLQSVDDAYIIAVALLPAVTNYIAAERARAVADLRAAVEAEVVGLEAEAAATATERHARTNSSARRQRGYAAGLRNAAGRLRAVLDATSEQQP